MQTLTLPAQLSALQLASVHGDLQVLLVRVCPAEQFWHTLVVEQKSQSVTLQETQVLVAVWKEYSSSHVSQTLVVLQLAQLAMLQVIQPPLETENPSLQVTQTLF